MTVMKKLAAQLVKPAMTSSRRVVSTTPRAEQSLATLNMDTAMAGQCPFRKTMDTFTDALNTRKVTEVPAVQPFENVPGPKGLPIIGTLLDYLKKDGLKFSKMFQIYQQRAQQYGPVFYERVGAFDYVIVSSPEEYNKLVQSEGKYPNRREMMPVAYYRQYKGFDLGLVNSQGAEWYKLRTVVSKKMLKLKEVSPFCGEMGEVADDFMTRLGKVRDVNGEVPRIEKELFKWAMESIGTFIFEERIGCLGDKPSSMAQAFIDNLEGFFKNLQPLMYNLPFYKLWGNKTWNDFEEYSDNIMDIGHKLVEKKLADMEGSKGSKSAFLSYLVNSSTMSTREVTGLVVDLLTAAVETTSTATTWCLYLLAKHPEVQEQLYKDMMAAADQDGQVSADALSQLPYAKSILKETLRLYPITYSTSRNISKDIQLGGYNIPAGMHVQANLYGMYHDPALFSDPEKFQPARWLRENSSKMDATVKAMSNLVWGHGARMCVGRRIAEQEMHITLCKIVQNYKLSYNHEDVEPTLNTMMTPDRPVRIQFTPRH